MRELTFVAVLLPVLLLPASVRAELVTCNYVVAPNGLGYVVDLSDTESDAPSGELRSVMFWHGEFEFAGTSETLKQLNLEKATVGEGTRFFAPDFELDVVPYFAGLSQGTLTFTQNGAEVSGAVWCSEKRNLVVN